MGIAVHHCHQQVFVKPALLFISDAIISPLSQRAQDI